jgi:alpha-amylase
MSSVFFNDDGVYRFFNPYTSPFEAFINYMNVLSDFKIRLNSFVPEKKVQNKIASLNRIIEEKDAKIKKYEAEINRLQKRKRTEIKDEDKP